jgi:hypothetical protein
VGFDLDLLSSPSHTTFRAFFLLLVGSLNVAVSLADPTACEFRSGTPEWPEQCKQCEHCEGGVIFLFIA